MLKEFGWRKLTIVGVILLLVFLLRPELGEKALDAAICALFIFGGIDLTKVVFKGLKELKK